MSYYVEVRIYCDHVGCEEPEYRVSQRDRGGLAKTAAAWYAKSNGWHISGNDPKVAYCPKHAAAHRRGTVCGAWFTAEVPDPWEPDVLVTRRTTCRRLEGHTGEHSRGAW